MPLISGGKAVILKILKDEPTYVIAKIYTVRNNMPLRRSKHSVDFVGVVLFNKKNNVELSRGDAVKVKLFSVKSPYNPENKTELPKYYFSIIDWEIFKKKTRRLKIRKDGGVTFGEPKKLKDKNIPKYTGSSFNQDDFNIEEFDDLESYDSDDEDEDY